MLGRGRGWGALSLVFYVKLQNDQILVSLTSYFFLTNFHKLSPFVKWRKCMKVYPYTVRQLKYFLNIPQLSAPAVVELMYATVTGSIIAANNSKAMPWVIF